ncbi:hypothetical protein HELRODRAFT_73306 [Helobdella robusta]|uniref:Uncharacterized protein n=1 Tax=Helobdella robusta TaxID=6412 RepID=T1G1C7_HELRO|nr:hypothetical protein HELRODRAFT_73306 [Helobdella robusta]ESO09914.1 hypothetical protein HELRODRAFT_73306 [Helobdella robusta]
MPLWSLAAVGYVIGQIFMVKYFVIWSLSSAVARLDQIVTADPPCCISRVYSYSQMWRFF